MLTIELTIDNICPVAFSRKFFSKNYLQIIVKASATEFIFSKVPCFYQILKNTFRTMGVKYENHL